MNQGIARSRLTSQSLIRWPAAGLPRRRPLLFLPPSRARFLSGRSWWTYWSLDVKARRRGRLQRHHAQNLILLTGDTKIGDWDYRR